MIDIERRGVAIACEPGPGSLERVAELVSSGERVIAALLDTGSADAPDPEDWIREARERGAEQALAIDLRQVVFDRYLVRLIQAGGAVARGSLPWLASEDYALADHLAHLAVEAKVAAVAFPPTWGSGSRRRREAKLREVGPGLRVLPSTLEAEPERGSSYRVRERLWGTCVWGRELDGLWEEPDEDAFPNVSPPWEDHSDLPEEFELEFEGGIPRSVFGQEVDGVSLFTQLTGLGRRHSVGRGLTHNAAGRVAWEAPATTIIALAHESLEAVTLTQRRRDAKSRLTETFAQDLLAGRHADPLVGDIEAFLDSCQADVNGVVRVQVGQGTVEVLGVRPATED